MMRGIMTVGAFLAVVLLLAAPVATPVGAKAQATESGVRFDSTVTLGNLLTAFVFLVGLIGAFATFKARLAVIETKLDVIWQAWLKDHRREETD